LTRLKDDPAAGWLAPIDRVIVLVKGWAAWCLFLAFIYGVRTAVWTLTASYLDSPALAAMFGGVASRIPLIVGGVTFAALVIPMRRTIVRIRANTIEKMARQAGDFASPVDDLSTLDEVPDGRVVSLVGWVRGHGYVDRLVDGQRAVGLTVRCQEGMLPFVLETMHNFDLVDESGNEALVLTGDGRLYGEANVRLNRASNDDKQLVVSLDIPASAVLTDWNVFAVRDGDPVMVVGTKSTVPDMTQLQHNRSPYRTAITSTKTRPLLVFPISAERRSV
jgi:hypothetical protein